MKPITRRGWLQTTAFLAGAPCACLAQASNDCCTVPEAPARWRSHRTWSGHDRSRPDTGTPPHRCGRQDRRPCPQATDHCRARREGSVRCARSEVHPRRRRADLRAQTPSIFTAPAGAIRSSLWTAACCAGRTSRRRARCAPTRWNARAACWRFAWRDSYDPARAPGRRPRHQRVRAAAGIRPDSGGIVHHGMRRGAAVRREPPPQTRRVRPPVSNVKLRKSR